MYTRAVRKTDEPGLRFIIKKNRNRFGALRRLGLAASFERLMGSELGYRHQLPFRHLLSGALCPTRGNSSILNLIYQKFAFSLQLLAASLSLRSWLQHLSLHGRVALPCMFSCRV
jgi:hypothetical protein